ncbi:hypothetical protein [Polaromonas naphthalenivorans]|uniref:hypothetical protein n=1 Tax=Polaromonas naphthalenivorans TaxID=216465 RepID=UPI0012EE276C|nr:hypothetical protein [Polaromonas naphthalenivorans]
MPFDEFIIHVYCEICEAYAAVASMCLRLRGFARAAALLGHGMFCAMWKSLKTQVNKAEKHPFTRDKK